MTAAQQARLAGFNASLAQRGVSVSTPQGKAQVLVELSGIGYEETEAGSFGVEPSKLHVPLGTAAFAELKHGDLVTEDKSRRVHRVLRGPERLDFKLVFHCVLE